MKTSIRSALVAACLALAASACNAPDEPETVAPAPGRVAAATPIEAATPPTQAELQAAAETAAAAAQAIAPSLSASRSIVRNGQGCQEWAPGRPPRAVECPDALESGELLRFLTETTCSRSGVAGREAQVPCPTVKALP